MYARDMTAGRPGIPKRSVWRSPTSASTFRLNAAIARGYSPSLRYAWPSRKLARASSPRSPTVRAMASACSPDAAACVRAARHIEAECHVRGHPTHPMQIPERSGQGLGLAEVVEQPLDLAEAVERDLKIEPEVDGLLARLGALGQMRQGAEGLLEAAHGLPVRGSRHGLGGGLAEVRHGLRPHLAPQGVLRQPLDLLAESIGVECLDRLHDPGVKRAPPLVEHAAVGHLVRERVLEGVFEIREEARLVEELGGLQMREPCRATPPRAAPRSRAAARRARPCRRPTLTAAGSSPRAAAGRCAPRGRPARSPGPGCSRGGGRAGTVRDRRRACPSRRARARSPRGRTGCPRCARSGAGSAGGCSHRRRAARRATRWRSPRARDRCAPGCSTSCCPRGGDTPGGSSRGAGGGRRAGSRPGHRARPGSRRRSSGDPRRPGRGAGAGSPGAAGA